MTFNLLKRVFMGIVAIIMSFIPLWFYLALKAGVSPNNFWESIASPKTAVMFLGPIQLLFFIALVRYLNDLWNRRWHERG